MTTTASDTFYVKRGDTGDPLVRRLVKPTGEIQPLHGIVGVWFVMRDRVTGETIIDSPDDQPNAVVVDANEGIVKYEWQDGDTDRTPNTYEAEFIVVFANGKEVSYPTVGFIPVVITRDVPRTA